VILVRGGAILGHGAAAMEWMVTVEGADEYGQMQRAQLRIEKGFERLLILSKISWQNCSHITCFSRGPS